MKPKLKATRYNCIKNFEESIDQDLDWYIQESKSRPGEMWLHVKRGVTGFESIQVDRLEEFLNDSSKESWCACGGTPNSWDKLIISLDSLRLALEYYKSNGFDACKYSS